MAYAGTGSSTALFKGIAFDVTNKLKLKTVKVYPKNTIALTPITVALFDSTGNVVSGTTPVTFTPSLNTGTIGTVSQDVVLNYNIPVGTGYRLVVTNGLVATTNTLGNSTAVITYPTTGALRLTGNVSALNDAVATAANATNCFHNLTFDETCESTSRTPVTATVGPCASTINLKLFIEGYYIGGGAMAPVKFNQDQVSPLTDVETISVELHSASSPYGVIDTTTAMLKTDGTAVATFASAPTGSFYISVSGLNTIKTWSKLPQTVGGTTSYDFSTAVTQSYGDNMKNIGGVYTLYSGDINLDGSIDGSDAPQIFDDVDNSAFGVQSTDLNGDGSVDNSDVPLFLDNSDLSIYSHDPNNP